MQSFTWNLQLVEEGAENTSILATIASPIAVILVPVVGVAAWQLAAAAVTGFIAKENVVGTLAVCYGFVVNDDLEMVGSGNDVATAMVGMIKVAALAYLMFNLFTPPCFAAMGAMNSEIKQKKWFWGGIGLQLATGYSVGFLVYQIGTLITTGSLGAGFVGGLIFLLAFAAILVYLFIKDGKARFFIGAVKGYKVAIAVAAILIVIFGSAFTFGFNTFWTMFHELVFTNDLWLLDPRVSTMINMYPLPFWLAMCTDMMVRFAVIFFCLYPVLNTMKKHFTR